MTQLRDLLAAAPHKNALREVWVYHEFEQQNASPRRLPVENFFGKPLKASNVMVSIQGSDHLPPIYLTAHHDHEGSGAGVVDNWSGVVALIELYERFSVRSISRPLIFVSFALEELGAIGSSYFVRQLGDSPVHANVNLECLGPGPMHCWTYREGVLPLPAEVPRARYDDIVSDAQSFHEIAGCPTIIFDGIAAVSARIIHTERDTIDAIDMQHYLRSLDQIEDYVRDLDSRFDLDPHGESQEVRSFSGRFLGQPRDAFHDQFGPATHGCCHG